MRTRKNPCPGDKIWAEPPEADGSRRLRDPPETQTLNGLCPNPSPDAESKGDLKKPRNGRKQRKRKRSPRAKAGDSQLDSVLAGLAADRVWLDKPVYDRAESLYRQKLADLGRGEAAAAAEFSGIPGAVKEFPGIPNWDIPKGLRCSHGILAACHHVVRGVWLNKLDFEKAEEDFMEKSQFSLPPTLLVVPGTPDEGYGTGLPTPATPGIPDVAAAAEQPPVNGKPQISNREILAAEVWLEKPLYDAAEKSFYEGVFAGNAPEIPESSTQEIPENPAQKMSEIPENPTREIPENPTQFFLHRDSESVWLQKPTYDAAESRFFAREASREKPGIPESPLGNPSRAAPGMKKMDYFLHDKVWLEKHKYDDAERRFYERLNGPTRPQEAGASPILREISRARENIQKSLAASSSAASPGAAGGDQPELLSRISHLEAENQNLRGVVAELQMAIFKLESRLNALEKSSSTSHQPSPVPPTQ
ncbi:EF1D factor, partial [Pitta sordida]|nr:EF1D factor [Pitta sordida]